MKRLIILILFLCFGYSAKSQFTRIEKPNGGNIRTLKMIGGNIYAIESFSNLYKYSKTDSLWTKKSLPPTVSYFSTISGSEYALFLGTSEGLYISQDDGENWKLETFNLPAQYDGIHSIEYFDDYVYVKTTNRLYRYDKYGDSYVSLADSLPSTSSMFVKDSIIILTSDAVSDAPKFGPCIWISYDGGENFTDITTDDIIYKYLEQSIIFGDTIFVTSISGMYKSHITDIKWVPFNGPSSEYFYKMGVNENEIYGVLPSGYLFYSKDGCTWECNIPQGISSSDFIIYDILVEGDEIYLGNTIGVLYTNDKGHSFSEINTGLQSIDILDMSINSHGIYLACYRSELYFKSHTTHKWERFCNGIPNESFYSIYATEDKVFSGSYGFHGVYYSEYNNPKKQLLSESLPKASCNLIEGYNEYLFIATKNYKHDFFRVKNDGSQVDTLKIYLSDGTEPQKLYITDFAGSEQVQFCVSPNCGIFKSTNDGLDWEQIIVNENENGFWQVEIVDDICYIGSANGNLYCSYDFGETWTELYHANDQDTYINKIRVKEDLVFFSVLKPFPATLTDECGVLIYNHINDKVTNVSEPLGKGYDRWVRDIEIFKDSIIVAAVGGLYAGSFDYFKSVSVEDIESSNYLYLCQPYPLPAYDNVNIEVYWDNKLNINNSDMNVYDIYGAKICGKERITLRQNNSWSGIVTLDCREFLPGIYFVQIKHGNKTKTSKILIE